MHRIHVLSFDIDGCLFGSSFVFDSDPNKSVISHNIKLLEHLKQSKQPDDVTVVFIGSNRQSLHIDNGNREIPYKGSLLYKGSCFPRIQTVCEFLEVEFDPLLLADVYNDLPDGHSFAEAIRHIELHGDRCVDPLSCQDHAHWIFDKTKLSILYVQLHKIASQYPDAVIDYDFYDDRKDILAPLNDFFVQYSWMMPENVSMRLYEYAGKDAKLFAEVKGNGIIDRNYRQTIKEMYQQIRSEDQPEHLSRENLALLSVRPSDLDFCATIKPPLLRVHSHYQSSLASRSASGFFSQFEEMKITSSQLVDQSFDASTTDVSTANDPAPSSSALK